MKSGLKLVYETMLIIFLQIVLQHSVQRLTHCRAKRWPHNLSLGDGERGGRHQGLVLVHASMHGSTGSGNTLNVNKTAVASKSS